MIDLLALFIALLEQKSTITDEVGSGGDARIWESLPKGFVPKATGDESGEKGLRIRLVSAPKMPGVPIAEAAFAVDCFAPSAAEASALWLIVATALVTDVPHSYGGANWKGFQLQDGGGAAIETDTEYEFFQGIVSSLVNTE